MPRTHMHQRQLSTYLHVRTRTHTGDGTDHCWRWNLDGLKECRKPIARRHGNRTAL